jgi:hypothetical protein
MSSDFENLPLPVNRDAQDYSRLVPPNSAVEIPVVGEFVYCKFSDGSIRVVINGKSTLMESGDERRSGGTSVFRGVTLINDNDTNQFVEFVIGFGGFNRVIVRGEITAELKIRTAEGSYIDDTKTVYDLDLRSVIGSGLTETAGEEIATLFNDKSEFEVFNWVGDSGSVEYPLPNFAVSYDFNKDVHDGVMLYTLSTETGYFRLLEIDPISKTLIRDWGGVADQGAPESGTRFGNTIYVVDSGTVKSVMTVQNNVQTVFYTPENTPRQLTVLSNGNVLLFHDGNPGGNQLTLLDQQGNVLKSVSTLFAATSFGHRNGFIWLYNTAGRTIIIDPETLDIISEGPNLGTGTTFCIYYNYALKHGVGNQDNQQIMSVLAIETVTDLLAGVANPVCENSWLGPPPSIYEAVRTTANITVTGGQKTNPTVTGELLKLILEYFTGGPVNSNYMDFIHAVEIQGATGTNGASFPKVQIASSGQTFAAAGVVDYFTQIFPLRVKITLDNRMNQL